VVNYDEMSDDITVIFESEYVSLKMRNGHLYAFTYWSESPMSSLFGSIEEFKEDIINQIGANSESRDLWKAQEDLINFIDNNRETLEVFVLHES